MKNPKTPEDKINKFLEIWSRDDLREFIEEIETVFRIIGDEDDPEYVERVGGIQNVSQIKIVATVHVISRMCDNFAGKMSITKMSVPKLWLDLENSIEAERAKNDSDTSKT